MCHVGLCMYVNIGAGSVFVVLCKFYGTVNNSIHGPTTATMMFKKQKLLYFHFLVPKKETTITKHLRPSSSG